MLKVNKTIHTNPSFILDVNALEDSSQKNDYFNSLMNEAINDSINPISDNEVTEFIPEVNHLNFYVFFSAIKNSEWLNQLVNHTEEHFTSHVADITTNMASQAVKTYTNPKHLIQANELPVPNELFNQHKKRVEVVESLPYTVLDPVYELTHTTPTQEGVPVFYNTFALPFAKKIDKWKDEKLGFSNKSFLYNSFMLVDFYTSNDQLAQKKILSMPIYVSGRYMAYETSTTNIKQVRPAFNLTKDSEGFSLLWLKKFGSSKLYARFSFWDALNGTQIQLVPSSQRTPGKKWVQNPNSFKHENLYLEYELDYAKRTYKIKEYNPDTEAYDLVNTDFDLFELIYDEYFALMEPVLIERPEVDFKIDDEDVSTISLYSSLNKILKVIDIDFNNESFEPINFTGTLKPLSSKIQDLFVNNAVRLRDSSLGFFKDNTVETVGELTLTNTTDKILYIKKVEIKNVRVNNKNNFIDGNVITTNLFTRTAITQSPSYYNCETVFSFENTSFFTKMIPLQNSYNDFETKLINKDVPTYDNYFYNESNDRLVGSQANFTAVVDQLPAGQQDYIWKGMLMKGGATMSFADDNQQKVAKAKGLNLSDKELNMILRSDNIQRNGIKLLFDQVYPLTNEKLVHNTSAYTDFSVTINTSITPQFEQFVPGLSVTLNSNVAFGRHFFKLFMSIEDEIEITYDVVVTVVDDNKDSYTKVIPCVLKYV